jgi:signal transduction histidine kinase
LERRRAERDLQRAEEQLQQYAQRQQFLSRQLLETQETERRRIAHELHDEIGQALTAVQLNLTALLRHATEPDAVQRLQESMNIVDRVLEQAHDLSLDLRPSMLDDLGLTAALPVNLPE